MLAGAAAAFEGTPPPVDSIDLPDAQIVLLGEVHDNGAHHDRQAAALKGMEPAAVVFEMLTPAQADVLADSPLSGEALAEALDWDGSGWPDFSLYEPVIEAARATRVYGMAVPRADLGAVFDGGAAAAFGPEAARFGLDQPLPDDEQAAREEAQFAAHCEALPREMLPGMVEAQRFRDAVFARTILQALVDTGGPVAVIAGNGHVRKDWGIPVYLSHAAPEVTVLSVGQVERQGRLPDDAPYDLWILSAPAERDDPCAVFAR
ncbi:ChaN family lipoprotein [Meridianimarinicoccus marinus]|uniref:ChaN family lipoprotein n=1 Tax=Meridianimarinicoccus marinus TaxID=3231483 RepID=UPI00344C0ADC